MTKTIKCRIVLINSSETKKTKNGSTVLRGSVATPSELKGKANVLSNFTAYGVAADRIIAELVPGAYIAAIVSTQSLKDGSQRYAKNGSAELTMQGFYLIALRKVKATA